MDFPGRKAFKYSLFIAKGKQIFGHNHQSTSRKLLPRTVRPHQFRFRQIRRKTQARKSGRLFIWVMHIKLKGKHAKYADLNPTDIC